MTRVSVVLPVYNGEKFLQAAIASTLNQTYADLELIVIDDASSDNSSDVVQSFDDPRLRYLRNPHNLGLPGTLNRGIEMSSGEFIARQDQDDLSDPRRIARQMALMERNPRIGLVGTWAKILHQGDDGSWQVRGEHRHPADDATLRWRLLWNSPFVHSSVLMRRSTVESAGLYSVEPDRLVPEDYDLWIRMSQFAEIANIPEFLHYYRQSPGGMSRAMDEAIRAGVSRMAEREIRSTLPREFSDEDVHDVAEALNGRNRVRRKPREQMHWTHALWLSARSIHSAKSASYWRDVLKTWLRVMRNSTRISP